MTLSLISYHFKVKENLYREVLRRILTPVGAEIDRKFGIHKKENDRLQGSPYSSNFIRGSVA